MTELIKTSVFFPVLCSVAFYLIGDFLRKKLRVSAVNPLLISVIITIALCVLLDIDYKTYYDGAKYLSYLLTPATVSLAIPLYRQLHALKDNKAAILAGILCGSVTSMACVFAMSLAFGLTHAEYVTFLPKSITTAIGIEVSEALGGDPAVAAAAIIITGIIGNAAAPLILKIFRITEPVAKGVAIGTSAHAVGTAKALELGETEGAVSSLSIVVAGIITVLAVPAFSGLI